MKIRVDARVLLDKYYSGISSYLAQLLPVLMTSDKSNHYLLWANSYQAKRIDQLNPFLGPNSEIEINRYPNKLFNYCLQKVWAWPKLDQINSEVDIFFAPHFNFIKLSPKTKFVLTVHDLSFLRYPEFFSSRKNFWHKSVGVKQLLKRADRIIAVSDNTKQDLIEFLAVPADKIRVIYSGNNISKTTNNINSSDSLVIREEIANLEAGFIFYLGNIEPRKNLTNLIKAYTQLRQTKPEVKDKLILAGLPAWRNKEIFQTWRQSPYQKEIKFLGYVNEAEKDLLFRKARVFAYPSFYEGFGFPPLEAFSYQVPVVSANVSSLPEVLADSAILVNPFKVDELAQALYQLIDNEELRLKLSAKGLEQVAKFNWHATAKQYLEVFTDLAQ